MKRKIEEKIIALAYGELDASEAQSLLQRIANEPELQRVYDAYRRQAELLKAVPPPPTPLLSSQHLRDAVFQQAVRTNRSLHPLTAAGAVAAAVFTLFAVQRASERPETPVLDLSPAETPVVALQDLPAPHEWVPSLVEDIQPNSIPEHGSSTQSAKPARKQRRAQPESHSFAVHPGTPKAKQQVPSVAPQDDSKSPEAETVVILQDGGKAIEMEGTDGVAFGG